MWYTWYTRYMERRQDSLYFSGACCDVTVPGTTGLLSTAVDVPAVSSTAINKDALTGTKTYGSEIKGMGLTREALLPEADTVLESNSE